MTLVSKKIKLLRTGLSVRRTALIQFRFLTEYLGDEWERTFIQEGDGSILSTGNVMALMGICKWQFMAM